MSCTSPSTITPVMAAADSNAAGRPACLRFPLNPDLRRNRASSAAGPLLQNASTSENILEGKIPLVTGVFVDQLRTLPHGNHCGPGFRPNRRIVDREFVLKRVRADACEAFDHMQARAGPPEVEFGGKVCGVDNKRVAFPMPAGITHPLADARGDVWAPVERNAAMFVDHLVENRHISSSLDNLHLVVVRARHYGQRACRQNAALRKRPVFVRVRTGPSKLGFPVLGVAGLSMLLPPRPQGRTPAVGWIYNQRRAPGSDNRVSPVVPELVVGNNAAGRVLQPSLLRVDELTIRASIFFPFKGRRFVIRQKLFP